MGDYFTSHRLRGEGKAPPRAIGVPYRRGARSELPQIEANSLSAAQRIACLMVQCTQPMARAHTPPRGLWNQIATAQNAARGVKRWRGAAVPRPPGPPSLPRYFLCLSPPAYCSAGMPRLIRCCTWPPPPAIAGRRVTLLSLCPTANIAVTCPLTMRRRRWSRALSSRARTASSGDHAVAIAASCGAGSKPGVNVGPWDASTDALAAISSGPVRATAQRRFQNTTSVLDRTFATIGPAVVAALDGATCKLA
jgi:hypothetical protein